MLTVRRHMVEDLKIRSKIESGRKLSNHEKRLKQVLAGENPPEKDISAEDGNQSPSDGDDWLRDKQMQLIDLERNILQVDICTFAV